MTPGRRVVLCADDFGMTEGVSRGILELAAQGRLSATGAMTSFPWWPRLAPDLLPLRGKLGIGLHLNLTTGAPLGPMPTIAPAGRFPTFRDLLARALAGRLSRSEIMAEFIRQLHAFEDVAGQAPDFVDGHQHVHVLPTIRQALFAALHERGYTVQPWLRDPSDRIPAILGRRVAADKALVVRALSLGFRRMAATRGFKTNDGFSGFSSFDRNVRADLVIGQAFTALGPRPVVMCHPGYVDDELRTLDPVVETRADELAFLASNRFAGLLADAKIILSPWPM